MRLQCFTLFQDDDNNNKTLITKNGFYILLGGLSMSALAWACQPKPPLHGLSFKKSPIKNHATLFQVGLGRQLDQTQTRLHKTQQISHLETSSITNISGYPPKKKSLIPATHPPVLKLEDVRIASTSQ